MKNLFILILCMQILVSITSGQEFQKTPGPVQLEDGDTFVFIGNSITHQCLYTQYVENYYYTRYPNKRIHFHNAGVSGDVAADVLNRFAKDIAAYNPKYASLLIGMNDGRYQRMNDEILDDYTAGMLGIVDSLQSIGTAPILITPTMFDIRPALAGTSEFEPDYARSMYYNSTLAYFGTWALQIANEKGLGFIDMFEPLNRITRENRKDDPEFTLIEDTIHPGEDGQVVMALAFLKDIGADPVVSVIHIDVENDGWEVIKANKGELEKLNDENIKFNFTAESLPWVLPEDAALGCKLTEAGELMSREIVKVTGLSKGEYDLLIDDKTVGNYSHLNFADGVKLQENKLTPQYQQAAEIAALNKLRNEEVVAPIRDLWLIKKIIRAYNEMPEKFEDDEAKKWVEDYLMKEFDSLDVTDFNQQFTQKLDPLMIKADELEEKIYKMNKPAVHIYEIIKK